MCDGGLSFVQEYLVFSTDISEPLICLYVFWVIKRMYPFIFPNIALVI